MAVFTHIDAEDVAALLAEYDIGTIVSLKGIAEGVQNSNFLLETDSNASTHRFIVTIYESPALQNDLPFFLGLMQHLAKKGINCPLPVQRRDGALMSKLGGKPAAIVTFLKGMGLRNPTPRHCAELGKGLADLHLAGADFNGQRENNLGHQHWAALFAPNAALADRIMPGMEKEIAQELDRIHSDWPNGLPSGLIHADLFPDNAFFLDHALSGIIDFYFACTDLWAYDLAICLNAWCFEADGAFNLTKAQGLLRSYHAHRPLLADEVSALPILCAGAAMRFLLTRLHDWEHRVDGALVTPKDPVPYLRRLRFHKAAQSARDYGVDL